MSKISEQDSAFVNSVLKQTCLPLTAVEYKEGIAFMPPRHLQLAAEFDQIAPCEKGYKLCWHEYITESAQTPAHSIKHETGPYQSVREALEVYMNNYILQIIDAVYEASFSNMPQ